MVPSHFAMELAATPPERAEGIYTNGHPDITAFGNNVTIVITRETNTFLASVTKFLEHLPAMGMKLPKSHGKTPIGGIWLDDAFSSVSRFTSFGPPWLIPKRWAS